MKLKNVLLTLGLALGVGVAAGAGLNESKGAIEAKATTGSRYNFAIASGCSWTNDNATTMLYDGETSYSAELTVDSDIGSTVKLADNNTYTLHTGLINLGSLGSSWNNLRFSRNVGGNWYNHTWGGWREGIKNGQRNLIVVSNSGNDFSLNEWELMYWKLTTYAGSNDYSDLENVEKSAALVANGSSVSDPSTEAPDGMSFAGWYTDPDLEDDWSGTVTSDLTLYAKYAANTFTVTKEIYKDDVLDSSTIDSVAEGDDYHLSAPASIAGYVFDGWYTRVNDDWGTKITSLTNVTNDQTVGARFRSRAQYTADSYIYYVADLASGTTMTPNYIYAYGGDTEFGAWPGTKISDLVEEDLHGSIGFRGWADYGYNRCIFRIPFNSVFGDTNVILNAGNNSDESASMSLVSGSAYYWGGKDDDAGAAIDFLLITEGFRNDVTASAGILNYSVCGIDPSDAADIYGDYEKLTDKAKGYVCDSFVYTYTGKYDGVTVPGEGSVDYEDVIAEILTIALKDTKFKEDHPTLGASPIFFDSDNSGLIIAVTAFAAILATGGFFFLRRRKEN